MGRLHVCSVQSCVCCHGIDRCSVHPSANSPILVYWNAVAEWTQSLCPNIKSVWVGMSVPHFTLGAFAAMHLHICHIGGNSHCVPIDN